MERAQCCSEVEQQISHQTDTSQLRISSSAGRAGCQIFKSFKSMPSPPSPSPLSGVKCWSGQYCETQAVQSSSGSVGSRLTNRHPHQITAAHTTLTSPPLPPPEPPEPPPSPLWLSEYCSILGGQEGCLSIKFTDPSDKSYRRYLANKQDLPVTSLLCLAQFSLFDTSIRVY